ncbi:MAG TPA: metalloregulator ArsR/SmtB family transcription factor [Gammaproteobacteria bacterium]|nr:metalloregulator ArsR/SmtB family transcription factor [Gammaproteobacteria bacterium]
MATRKTTTPVRKVKTQMSTDQMSVHANDAANLLRAMASEHRLMVLCSLVQGEMSVSQLMDVIPLAQSALSQHLAVLRRERLVSTRREGQTVFYGLKPGPAMSVIRVLYDSYCCNLK